jgi:hypothetical protein
MEHRRLSLLVLLISLLTACSSTPSATVGPSPTARPATSAPTATPALPTATPASDLTPLPTDVPIITPTPTPDATPYPSPVAPSPTPGSGIWQALPDFPPPAADISDVAADADEFVVAGATTQADGCPDGHIWTGPDGGWFDAIHVDTHNATVLALTQPFGWPAFGHAGWGGCGASEVTAYMPTDKADWFQPTLTGFLGGDEVIDAVQLPSFDGVVASGALADDGDHAGVWLGQVALHVAFRRSSQPPTTMGELTGLGVVDQTVFGFDSTADRPAWYSADSGDTWQGSPFRPDFWFINSDSAAFEGTEFVGGSACCTSPGVRAGMILSSTNGIDWQPVTPLGLAASVWDMAALPTGLIAVTAGRDVYLSSDGSDWRKGPRLPSGAADGQLFVAATDTQVLVVSNSGAWLASAADLDAARWPKPTPAADVPAVGDVYPRFGMNTTCPPSPIRFDLRTWMPDPTTLVDGAWPPSFDPNQERGKLTFAAQDRLVFTGEQGAMVDFEPSAPVESAPCA